MKKISLSLVFALLLIVFSVLALAAPAAPTQTGLVPLVEQAQADGYSGTPLSATNTMTWLGAIDYYGAGSDAGYPVDNDVRLSMYVANGFWANRGRTACPPTWGKTGLSQNTDSRIISTGTLVGPGQCSLNQQKLTYDQEFWNSNINLRWSFDATTRRNAKRHLCAATVHEYGHLTGLQHSASSTYSIMNKVIDPVNRLPTECAQWFP